MKHKNGIPYTISLSTTVLLLLAGCGNQGKEGEKAAENKGGEKGAPIQEASNTAAPVRVFQTKPETVQETVNVTGSLQSLNNVNLTPKVTARIEAIAGREGTSVRAGQVVVQQDPSDFVRQLQQAQANLQAARAQVAAQEANLASAQARLTQAQTNLRLQQSQYRIGVQDAQEQVRSAQANLELTRRPQRSQEVSVAENDVRQAQANYEKAQVDRQRYEQLVKEGAAAQATLDQYATQEKVARATLDSAKERLAIAQEGGRQEQIRAGESQVARAQAALRLSQANVQQVRAREDDVRAARAAVEQARAAIAQARASVAQNEAAVGLARLNVENASIKSPIDGVISARPVEPGRVVGPGTEVLTVVSLSDVYFEAQVPGVDVAQVRQGQPVQVTIDAYPGRTFNGQVTRVYPTGSTASRIFNARVEIPNETGGLRPGLFVQGKIIAAQRQNAVTVPVEALVTEAIGSLDAAEAAVASQNTRVFVVNNGVAEERKVTPGLVSQDGKRVEVNNVQPGEQIVIVGQRGLKNGDKVTIQQPAQDSAAKQTATQVAQDGPAAQK